MQADSTGVPLLKRRRASALIHYSGRGQRRRCLLVRVTNSLIQILLIQRTPLSFTQFWSVRFPIGVLCPSLWSSGSRSKFVSVGGLGDRHVPWEQQIQVLVSGNLHLSSSLFVLLQFFFFSRVLVSFLSAAGALWSYERMLTQVTLCVSTHVVG